MALLVCGAISTPLLAAKKWSAQDIADGECVAYYSVLLGEADSKEPDTAAVARTTYFVGKVEGRRPGYDLKALMLDTKIFDTFDAKRTAIGSRCDREATKAAENMLKAGEAMQAAAGGS